MLRCSSKRINHKKLKNKNSFFEINGHVMVLAKYPKLELHYDMDICPAHSAVPKIKPMLKINHLSYYHYFSHVYS